MGPTVQNLCQLGSHDIWDYEQIGGHNKMAHRIIAATVVSVLNRSQGEMRIWEEVKQWSTSVSQVQVEELQRVT